MRVRNRKRHQQMMLVDSTDNNLRKLMDGAPRGAAITKRPRFQDRIGNRSGRRQGVLVV